jgi:hypothetical protein
VSSILISRSKDDNDNTIFHREPELTPLEATLDSDVRDEIEKVKAMTPKDIAEHNLVLRNLTKYFGNLLAVDRVNLAMDQATCFGLLGNSSILLK